MQVVGYPNHSKRIFNFSYQSLAANEESPLFYLLAEEFEDPYRIRKRDLTGHGPPHIRAEKM